MTRHSFIQMSKLSNVKGRISYITSHARQENLYATYRTADNDFWSDLAKECQQEFKRSGADGKCMLHHACKAHPHPEYSSPRIHDGRSLQRQEIRLPLPASG